jgi:hypothetical protein
MSDQELIKRWMIFLRRELTLSQKMPLDFLVCAGVVTPTGGLRAPYRQGA